MTEEGLEIAKRIAAEYGIPIGTLMTQILIDDYEREILRAFGRTHPPTDRKIELLNRLIRSYPEEARLILRSLTDPPTEPPAGGG